jgi:hypothetical protein
MVVEGVEDDREMIVVVEIGAVAAQVAGHAAGRVLFVHPGADIQVLVVEEHPDLGLVRRGPAFGGFLLDEVGHRWHVAVGRFVEGAVDDERRWQRHRPDGGVAALVTVDDRRRLGRGRTVDGLGGVCWRTFGRSRGIRGTRLLRPRN